METWLKSAIVALLTVAGATLVIPREYNIYLNTRENKEIVPLGSSLILHCCVAIEKPERCRVTYYFEGFNQTDKKEICCNTTDPTKCNSTRDGCQSTCTLFNISERDYGFYSCKVTVEIPVLSEVSSKRTEVRLTSQKEENENENLWMWIIVGASSFVLVVIALLVICVVRKRGCSRSIEQEPVYVNTRLGNPSPRLMPADNPKSASSSQDLRTPISDRRYEGRNQRYKH
ncbi:uncharacterized protein LOC108166235 isoform X2 [Poecilia reticulata]|uniref:uncharacterized protein LOC108166235 isoform X2 n=1 Tax=Poecilia reticulata TaxID=8081 RepID=UPI0007E9859C|nr:PREDICTED: uncharacterized protein LOC108166235 isoform X2 [Poecilia reticulata]